MQAANPNVAANENSGANGHTPLHDLFVLTDEQILEIEPEAQEVNVREDAARGDSPEAVSTSANELDSKSPPPSDQNAQSTPARVLVSLELPAWLA